MATQKFGFRDRASAEVVRGKGLKIADEQSQPVKIKITIIGSKYIYPDFDIIPKEYRNGQHWKDYLNTICSRFEYSNGGQPVDGVLYALTFMPESFIKLCEQYLEAGLVTQLTDAEAQSFYENDISKYQQDVFVDFEALQKLLVFIQLEERGMLPRPDTKELQRRQDMFNPDTNIQGIRRNTLKNWSNYKNMIMKKISTNQ